MRNKTSWSSGKCRAHNLPADEARKESLAHTMNDVQMSPPNCAYVSRLARTTTDSASATLLEGVGCFTMSDAHWAVRVSEQRPALPTPKYVTSKPCSTSKRRHDAKTHLCSVCVVTICFFAPP